MYRPRIKDLYDISNETIEELITEIYEKCDLVEGTYEVKVVEDDPKDNKFLACALEGKANYLITGDSHLANLKNYHGIQIISAKQLLEIVRRQGIKGGRKWQRLTKERLRERA